MSPGWQELQSARRVHDQRFGAASIDVREAHKVVWLLKAIYVLVLFNTIVINVWLILHA